MYKVGDRVLFTFLSQRIKGEIIEKEVGGKFKVMGDKGIIYPSIYAKTPAKKKGKALVNPLGLIINKID